MAFKLDDLYIGSPPIENVVPAPSGTALPTVGASPGQLTMAEAPDWGPGEFMFARAGGAIPLASLCVLTSVWDSTNRTMQQNMVVCPNTANMGKSVYIYVGNTALTTGQYAWFMAAGTYPLACNATVAADTTYGIAAAGQGGANSAGKQILNSRVVIAATQTVTATGRGANGDTVIYLSNTQGFFPGVYVSGTGVGASAICASVDPLGRFITVTVANSAAFSGQTITATYNNGTIFYNVVTIDRGFAQGAIT